MNLTTVAARALGACAALGITAAFIASLAIDTRRAPPGAADAAARIVVRARQAAERSANGAPGATHHG